MASFQQLLQQKDCIFGLFVNLNDPTVVELAHLAGFDFIRIDLEHKMYDPVTVLSLIRTADLLGMAVQVRISSLSEVTRLLDAGAHGIVVPGTTSVASAKEAIDAVKYHPLGERGISGDARWLDYGQYRFIQKYPEANDNVALIVQMENKRALAHMDDILALEGIDMVATGRYDLSQALGIPGQNQHPDVLALEAQIIQKALAHGKMPMILAGTAQRVRELREMGVRAMTVTQDTKLLMNGMKQTLGEIKSAL